MQNENINQEVVSEVSTTPKIVTMQERDMNKVTKKQKVVKIIVTTAVYIFLFAVAISVLFPFYWMLNSSIKSVE